jgi:hypothetical protein
MWRRAPGAPRPPRPRRRPRPTHRPSATWPGVRHLGGYDSAGEKAAVGAFLRQNPDLRLAATSTAARPTATT